MLQAIDQYPSRRREDISPFPRNEPVIHGRDWQSCRSSDGPLTTHQMESYEEKGFLWMERFFSQEWIEPFFKELKEIARSEKLRKRREVIMDTQGDEVKSVFAMHTLSKRFAEIFSHPDLLSVVQQLIGSDVYIHQSRINYKSGFQGSGFEWHSDFETWHTEDGMPRMRAVSASIMLTDNNPFNGPLMLIPGSHKLFVPCQGATPDNNWQQSLKTQKVGSPSEEIIGQLAEENGIEAPTGPAGSLLLFECNTLHASNRNMSPWPRANLFCVYNSVENRLERPFSGKDPRPDFLGARENTRALRAIR